MDNRKSNVRICICLNCFIILMLVLAPVHAERVYIQNYIVNVCCLLVVSLLYLRYMMRNGFDLFDPIAIITFIYSFMYFVTPIYDILIGKYTWFGYKLFPYGVKSGCIALLGYLAFYGFYTDEINIKIHKNSEPTQTEPITVSEEARKNIILVILVLYAGAFLANVYYLMHSGYGDFLYILTMGIIGKSRVSESLTSIGYLAMFSYSLPTLVLLYWEYSKRPWITLLLFFPVLMMQVSRGFRFLVIQIAISFAAYYFITRRKRPKFHQVVSLLFILMIPVIIMTLFRNDVRSGSGISASGITIGVIQNALDDAILDNFRIYNNFYGLVHAVPEKYGYVYGRQILIGTLVMVIPRAIWPNKISTMAGVDLSYIIGDRLAKTGQAYPGLGEYYYAFGVLGVVFFMAVYGAWMRHVKTKYMPPESGGLNTIAFSVLLGCNLQLLIRGYTPSNFWYIIFGMLPIFIIRYAEKYFAVKRSGRNGQNC